MCTHVHTCMKCTVHNFYAQTYVCTCTYAHTLHTVGVVHLVDINCGDLKGFSLVDWPRYRLAKGIFHSALLKTILVYSDFGLEIKANLPNQNHCHLRIRYTYVIMHLRARSCSYVHNQLQYHSNDIMHKHYRPYNMKNPFLAPVRVNRELHKGGDRSCMHIELDITDSSIR